MTIEISNVMPAAAAQQPATRLGADCHKRGKIVRIDPAAPKPMSAVEIVR